MNIFTRPITHFKNCNLTFCKTSNLNSIQTIKTLKYNEGLFFTIRDIQRSIELKAIDAISETVEVLKELNEYENSIYLDNADYIYIYKGGIDILKLENLKKPETGYSLYLMVKNNENKEKKQSYKMRILIGVGCVIISTIIYHKFFI